MSDLHRAEMAESKLDWIKRWIEAQPPQIRDAYRAVLTTIDAEVWDGYQTVKDRPAYDPAAAGLLETSTVKRYGLDTRKLPPAPAGQKPLPSLLDHKEP